MEQLDAKDGFVQEEEFTVIMKYIQQQKQTSSLPPIVDKSIYSMSQNQDPERKKYGALLPKVGVYFLPDEKILGLLK